MISLHANGIDAPVAVRKAGNTTIAPYANWKGDYEVGTTTDGTPTSSCTGTTTCPALDWPGGNENADGQKVLPAALDTWWGSLITGKTDPSGMKYMRNRYYNPSNGQFTQQDPIGLASGINLYGFAGGDPVNYSDPFGLCTDSKGKDVPCPDKAKVAKWMQDNAGLTPTGKCATWCRQGLEAGGFDSEGRPVAAGDYGPFLLSRGAGVVPESGYEPETGDIAVFAKTGKHEYGHIQIYDGKRWDSDFKQNGFIPYRDKASAGKHTIYRFPGTLPPIVVHPDN